ncbi:hypothetical protein QO002_001301 [Pararhizobium capsulatum DSM 1112]|uniref:Uncharacterized protein n=1 Tax=Pararhizobium capsulatum DSM 1112 TaxID=1121113 RepID=A0ABU0BMM5_9HYPH|nr:hypothetical protein [Pararhizobium capsulatum]MDQ0319163.1 hypothetical protein [Pararhizobium capsulatum DSM 1112]
MVPPKYFPDLDDMPSSVGIVAISPSPQPKIDLEAERREAFEEGRIHAEKELGALHTAALVEIEERHAAEMEALKSRCENEVAAMIFDRFSDMGSQLADLFGDQVARALVPVIEASLVEKAVADLGRLVGQTIAHGEACKITVKGPVALFEALKTHLTDETLIFRHIETADIDLSVEFGDSILVTRMAAWADTVRKVLA